MTRPHDYTRCPWCGASTPLLVGGALGDHRAVYRDDHNRLRVTPGKCGGANRKPEDHPDHQPTTTHP